ncbi:ion transporter [Veronia pacifica]|uniref:Ion transporter n=1 Tax=Veronia pacifica TaxID=1080227 RepID=A0A1C3ERS8_9GAMM|nr:ion transporter [Veronia pacifica]ODA35926.1 ion transporter [Veronia pacifica]
MENKQTPLQKHLYTMIFGTHTKAGKAFDIALIVVIISSIVVLMLDSVGIYKEKYGTLLYTIEWCFTAFFTIEYLLRLYCSPHRLAYARSFYGIIDVVAVLPTFLALFIPGASYLMAIRLLRVLRIFRILKLVRFLQESNFLLSALRMSARKIMVFFMTVFVLVTVFGSLMFAIEGPEHGFTSIPYSIYWAIVTMTTVGYGDLVPQTDLGKGLASLTMLMGYCIIAVPTGIITAQMGQEINLHRRLVKCPNCSENGHESDALYCKHCGSELPEPDKRLV